MLLRSKNSKRQRMSWEQGQSSRKLERKVYHYVPFFTFSVISIVQLCVGLRSVMTIVQSYVGLLNQFGFKSNSICHLFIFCEVNVATYEQKEIFLKLKNKRSR